MTEYLSPWEIAAYQSRTDQTGTNYQNFLAQDAYKRAQLGIYDQRNRDRLGQQFDQARNKLPGGFARRGLMNSGIYKQALENYGTARSQAFGDLDLNYTSQLGGFDVEKQGQTGTYNTSLAGIEAEKAARRSQLATELRNVM